MKPLNLQFNLLACALVFLSGIGLAARVQAQSVSVESATALRTDKLPYAAVVKALAKGSVVSVLNLEGGWAWVQAASDQGWVRASDLNLANARPGGVNAAPGLGVRSLPARANRHALIIGVSRYADPVNPPLPGARIDRESATQMARAMLVPPDNISYLQDEQATGDNIRAAIRGLQEQVQEGDKVFIHFSGHGTRYNDAAAGGCVEALLAHDGGQRGTITNREMSQLLTPITQKTDKLFVMYDACHSGGVIAANAPVRTRGIANPSDEGLLRPKFSAISEECGRPVNVKARNLVVEAVDKGMLPQDIIHISSSRDNEVSFDDELKGGLATQFMRDCMLREAKDLDGSGSISMEEIRQCAQEKINHRMQNDANYKAHTIVLSGNPAFVPAWFSQPSLLTTGPGPTPPPAPPSRPAADVPPGISPSPLAGASAAAPSPAASAASAPVSFTGGPPIVSLEAPPPPLTGAQALKQLFDQRSARRKVTVSVAKNTLKIGQDALDFSVRSDRSGYVYVAQAGSDNKALYLLFPNDLDKGNRIQANVPLALPRPHWRVKAGGPAGTDSLLVMVTDGPRDWEAFPAQRTGPFTVSLNDAQGRASLGALLTNSSGAAASNVPCGSSVARRNRPICSDAYGASLITVEEIP